MGLYPYAMVTHTKAMGLQPVVTETALARLVREQGRFKGWLAGELGISVFRLSRLLSGEREMTLREAARAAEILGVPIETFLPEEVA